MACTFLIRPFFKSAGLKWLAEKAILSSFRLSGTRLVQRLINENGQFPGKAAFADVSIAVKVPTHKKFSVM